MKTLDQLIEALTELRDRMEQDDTIGLGDEVGECRLLVAIQPHYPIAVEWSTVTAIVPDDGPPVVWLATSESPDDVNPYAPGQAWEGEIVYPEADDADLGA